MIALLKDWQAGKVRPKSKQERYDWQQRAREYKRVGIL